MLYFLLVLSLVFLCILSVNSLCGLCSVSCFPDFCGPCVLHLCFCSLSHVLFNVLTLCCVVWLARSQYSAFFSLFVCFSYFFLVFLLHLNWSLLLSYCPVLMLCLANPVMRPHKILVFVLLFSYLSLIASWCWKTLRDEFLAFHAPFDILAAVGSEKRAREVLVTAQNISRRRQCRNCLHLVVEISLFPGLRLRQNARDHDMCWSIKRPSLTNEGALVPRIWMFLSYMLAKMLWIMGNLAKWASA